MGFFGDSDSDDDNNKYINKIDQDENDTLDDYMMNLKGTDNYKDSSKPEAKRMDLNDEDDEGGGGGEGDTKKVEDRSCIPSEGQYTGGGEKSNSNNGNSNDNRNHGNSNNFTLPPVDHSKIKYAPFVRNFLPPSSDKIPQTPTLSEWCKGEHRDPGVSQRHAGQHIYI